MEAMKVQCFERKPRVWIGAGKENEDIMIPETACSLLILQERFLVKLKDGSESRNTDG